MNFYKLDIPKYLVIKTPTQYLSCEVLIQANNFNIQIMKRKNI